MLLDLFYREKVKCQVDCFPGTTAEGKLREIVEALACMEQSEKQKCINAKLMEGMTKEFSLHGQGLTDGVKRGSEVPRCLSPGCKCKPSCYRQPCCKGHRRWTQSSTRPAPQDPIIDMLPSHPTPWNEQS